MLRNLTATIALIISFVLLIILTLFQSAQINHFEELVLEGTRTQRDLTNRVSAIYSLLEGGELPQARTGVETSALDAGLPPVVANQQRYYSTEEWAGLMAPGNMLVPRTEPYYLEETVTGGQLVRSMIQDVPSLHPILDNAADKSDIYAHVSASLSARGRDNPDNWVADLAYRIESNEDNTQYHVYLREGIRWHRPSVDFTNPRYAWLDQDHYLTSDDFAFFFEIVRNTEVQAAHLANYFQDFDRIEIINDHEFIIHWSRIFQGSVSATLGLEPLPRWLYGYDEDGNQLSEAAFAAAFNQHWYMDKMIGVGPYRFVEWEPNVRIVLERNENYYDESPPIHRVVFRIVEDENARLNNLLSNDLDFIDILPFQFEQLITNRGEEAFHNGEVEHDVYQGTVYRYLGWNADNPRFSDRRIRRAMTHAFNRERIIRDIMHGLGRIQTGNFFIDSSYTNPEIEPWPFDLEEAARLLDQSGWVDSDGNGVRDKMIDGESLDFEFRMTCYGYRQEFMAAMEIYKSDLSSIGIEMHIDGVQWPVMIETMQNRTFDAYTGGWVMGWDADPYQIWHSTQADDPNGSNRVGFRNEECDEIIETARQTFELDERIALFHRFHEIVHEEQPYTFFMAGREISAWRSNVQNVNFSPLRPFAKSFSWYVDAP